MDTAPDPSNPLHVQTLARFCAACVKHGVPRDLDFCRVFFYASENKLEHVMSAWVGVNRLFHHEKHLTVADPLAESMTGRKLRVSKPSRLARRLRRIAERENAGNVSA